MAMLLSAAHSPTWKQPKKHAKCCNIEKKIQTESYTEEETCMNINTATVRCSMAIGVGFSQLGEFFAALDMPFKKVANKEMEKAAKAEATLARECGDVDKEYFLLVTVVADCTWVKDPTRISTAAIVGYRTKNVLHLEVRNKYCAICDRKHRESNIPLHKCYKNWTGASTPMEADGTVVGFTKSVPLHAIKYARLIGDGDSSIHKKRIESLPYGPDFLFEKIECRNQILPNNTNGLRELSLNKNTGTVQQRSKIRQNILRLRSGITKSIQHRKPEGLPRNVSCEQLRKDILNCPYRVFGNHTHRSERGYFCNGPKPEESNEGPAIKETGIFTEIQSALNRVAHYTNCLIEDVDNNCVEQFNYLVAKTIGEKHINFSMSQSFQVMS
ncbi:hypothetical protein PR048_014466, partial [Dryococelus australis]